MLTGRLRQAGVAGGLMVLVACGGGGGPEGAAVAARQPKGPTATVGVATADRGLVRETLVTYGTLEFDPDRTRRVQFVTAGQVAKVLVTAGEAVRDGQVLLQLAPVPSSTLEFQRAQIDVEFAERDLERLQRLREQHLATNEQVQQAEKVLSTARAVLAGLGGGASEPAPVRAPFAGVVEDTPVEAGTVVHSGDTAVLLAPARAVVVRAGFEPEDAAVLAPGLAVRLSPVFASAAAGPARARLARLHRVVDPRTQLVEALIEPEAPPTWMVAGTRVKVTVVVRSAADAVRVPRSALLAQGGRRGVYVVRDGRAVWTPLRLGLESEDFVEVTEGLAAGDEVVTTGRTSLTDGMRVAVAERTGG